MLLMSAALAATTWVNGMAQIPAAEAGCTSLTPAAVGGATAADSVITLRWLGTANYELVHGKTLVLLDAHYDRGPRNRPIGVAASSITRATVIFIGHAHSDHISDAATVARKTGAKVIGAASAIEVVRSLGVPADQTVTVTGRGGELLRFDGFTVEPVLARHSVLSRSAMTKFREIVAELMPAPTPAELEAEGVIDARGSSDSTVRTEGTIAYLFTFTGGLRLLFLDSAGPITEAERQLMRRIKQTDVAIIAYQGQYLAEAQMAVTLPLIKLFRPRLYIPTHHDALAGYFPDLGVEPLLMAIRDQVPGTSTIAPLYRTPICLNANVNREPLFWSRGAPR